MVTDCGRMSPRKRGRNGIWIPAAGCAAPGPSPSVLPAEALDDLQDAYSADITRQPAQQRELSGLPSGAGVGGGSGSAADPLRPTPIASFGFHKEQITSVEWHPTDDSIVAVSAGDNTVTLWDLVVELDDEESKDTAGVQDVPLQLLFVHYQNLAKEVHWHPQIPGALVAIGEEFIIFRTISV
ncbi:uncharacterized protein C8A04DRAFT_27169 [Dichotomopilus funicola]|uniref:Uncharacterized protein n=1 Tax=Dichotomopilus funicola TaxID=1934379 RepID=A0AAN6ZPE9_9PEZI|nr:hypothetical protein C8A04DRAFT_27169 [Dichotomopilus funicola]